MSAHRALLEPVEDADLEQKPGSARRALTLETLEDELRSVSALSSATCALAPGIGFEPDEDPVVVVDGGATQLPRGLRRSSLRLRRTLLGVATAATAGAVLVVPNLVNNVSAAQDRISHTIPVNDPQSISRDSDRSSLDAVTVENAQRAEERTRMAEARAAKAAEAQARAEAQAQLAEQAKTAEESRKAEEARIAEETRAAEEARAAEARAAEQAAAAQQPANDQPSANAPSTGPTRPAPVPSAGSASGAAQGAVAFALSQLGAPYVWGSTGPGGYDCSGLMVAAYASVGISLPRTSYAIASAGYAVSYGDLQPGDLIVSYGGGHVAMYIGNGQIVHAQDSSTGVITSPLSSQSIVAIRRVA